MADDVFNTENNSEENFLERLVGEGKKFKDPEALARGKHEADTFIEDLKRQNQELREDLDRASKMDDMLEEIRSLKQGSGSSTDGSDDSAEGGNDSNNTSSGPTEEQLQALIESHISQRETQRQAERNLSEVNEVIREKFGSKANEYLASKVSEVGLSVDRMKELASENPKAFYRLLGLDTDGQPNKGGVTVGGGVNSESGSSQNRGERDFAYYQALRRESRSKYFSPAVQKQMFEDRKRLGDRFYGGN